MIVRAELDNLGLHCTSVELGQVQIKEPLSDNKLFLLKEALLKSGLELLDDKRTILVEQIKNVIIEMIHYADEMPEAKMSVYLSNKLQYDYTYLANVFSEIKGISIKHFIIIHKIEKIRELIIYDELTFSEIAYRMQYSSSAHMTNQFKKITGFTPTYFKSLKNKRRRTLDDI